MNPEGLVQTNTSATQIYDDPPVIRVTSGVIRNVVDECRSCIMFKVIKYDNTALIIHHPSPQRRQQYALQ